MKSIYFKNFLSTALMVLMSFLIIGVALICIGQNFIINSHRDDMKSNAETVSRLLGTLSDDEMVSWAVRIALSGASEVSGNDIFLTDADGLVVSCSDDPGKCTHIGKSVPSEYINSTQTRGELDTVTDLDGLFPSPRYVYAMPVSYGAGYVFVSSLRSTIIGAWDAFFWVFFAVTLAVL